MLLGLVRGGLYRRQDRLELTVDHFDRWAGGVVAGLGRMNEYGPKAVGFSWLDQKAGG